MFRRRRPQYVVTRQVQELLEPQEAILLIERGARFGLQDGKRWVEPGSILVTSHRLFFDGDELRATMGGLLLYSVPFASVKVHEVRRAKDSWVLSLTQENTSDSFTVTQDLASMVDSKLREAAAAVSVDPGWTASDPPKHIWDISLKHMGSVLEGFAKGPGKFSDDSLIKELVTTQIGFGYLAHIGYLLEKTKPLGAACDDMVKGFTLSDHDRFLRGYEALRILVTAFAAEEEAEPLTP